MVSRMTSPLHGLKRAKADLGEARGEVIMTLSRFHFQVAKSPDKTKARNSPGVRADPIDMTFPRKPYIDTYSTQFSSTLRIEGGGWRIRKWRVAFVFLGLILARTPYAGTALYAVPDYRLPTTTQGLTGSTGLTGHRFLKFQLPAAYCADDSSF